MTDRAFDTDLTATPHATDNPFLAVTGAVRASQTAPAANDDDNDNPFLKITGRVAPATSATGSFVRGAIRSFLPAVGSLPAVGTGAELGAAAGAFGGPFAPFTIPLGTIAGGAIGGIGGGYALSALQHWGLSKLPESWVEGLGMSDRQEKLDAQYHGTASFIGGLAPYALTMRPGLAPKTALPPNATALQRVMAHPATAHVFGGGVVGGMELGQEAIHGEPTDWGKVAIATSFGVVFNKPYGIGEPLMNVGARPVRRALGIPEPATTPRGEAHEGAPAPPEPAAAPPLSVNDALDMKVLGSTENVFLGSNEPAPEQIESAREAKRIELSVIGPQPAGPDVHAVARRMHPELFEKYDELSSLRDEFRTWITQRNNPSDELIGQATERRDALQAKLDAHVADQNGYTGGAEARRLRAHVRDAQREIDGLQERRTAYAEGRAEQTAELIAARGHLLKAEYGLRDLHGEVQAAYRRAADAIGAGTVPPEPRGEAAAKTEANEPIQPELPHVPAAPPAVPAQSVVEGPAASPKAQEAIPAKAPEPPKPRTIEEQRDFIRGDVARALIRAGRPKDEAEAAGRLWAEHYETFANIFKGKIGTPEELYRKYGAEILGPGMRSSQGIRTSPPRKPKPPERMSLLEFADHLGGLQRTGDLAHTLDEDFKVSGRKLFRQDGLTEDRFREAASEAGYLVNNKETTGQQASLKELHEAIREEAKGKKRYRFGMEPQERVEAEGRGEEAPEAEEALEPHEMMAAAEGDQLGHLSEEDRAALELFQKESTTEHIASAAVRFRGKTYTGITHVEATEAAATESGIPFNEIVRELSADDDGFLTSSGRFVSRSEATQIAKDAKQIKLFSRLMKPVKRLMLGEKGADDPLMAEELKNDRELFQSKKLGPSDKDWENVRAEIDRENVDDGLDQEFGAVLDGVTSEGLSFRDAMRKYGSPELQEQFLEHTDKSRSELGLGYEPRIVAPSERDAILRKNWEEHGADRDWDFDNFRTFVREAKQWNEKHPDNPMPTGDSPYRFGSNPEFEKYFDEKYLAGKKETYPGAAKANEYFASEGDTWHLTAFLSDKEAKRYIDLDEFDVFDHGEQLNQTARGSVLFREGQRPVMRLMAEQNASTFIHESGHIFLEELLQFAEHPDAPEQLKTDAATTLKWLGINDHADLNTGWPGERGKKARAAHERFATGFEQYLREGTAPSPDLASVFAKFKNWLLSIYETLKGLGKPINEDIRNVFDRLLSEEPQRTVIATEREAPRGMANEHALDAQELQPHEADAGMARVDNERVQGYNDLPEDVRAELEAADAKFYAEHEAANAPGADSGSPEGPGAVQPPGGNAGVEPAGGGGGAASGAERTGLGKAGAEGAGLSGAEPGPGNRAQLESLPLAPAPAAEFPAGSSFTIGKAGNVRVENITSVPEFMRAIEESSERIGGGGPITMGEMMDLANEMAIDPSKISEAGLARMFGGVQNLAAKIFALRTAIADSAKIVHGAMAKVRDGGTDADVAEFARVVARHDMMQSVLSSVTSEVGRGLGMGFRNLENWKQAGDLNEFLKANTGRTLFQLKQIAKLGAQLDSPAKISKFLRDAQKRSFGGMILEYWINGLISGPATHVTYMMGNQILALQKAVPETLIAAGIGSLREAAGRQGERVRAGETVAGLKSMVQSLPAATQAFLEAMRTGQTTLLPGEPARPQTPFQGDTALTIAKSITNDPVTWREVGAQAFGMMRGLRDAVTSGAELLKAGGEPGAPLMGLHYSPLGQIPDIAVRGVPVVPLGSAIRLPGRSVAAIHSFFRTANYLREGAAEAYRVASDENLSGNAFAARIGDVRQNPTPEQMERWRAGATAATLMSDGGVFVKALSQLTNAKVDLPLIGELAPLKFIDPFVHIGANVINQAIVQRTPLGILSAEIRADLAGRNGNIAQDMAAARMLAGTALSLVFGSLAMEGYASGSGPKEGAKAAMWREAGYQPHSIRVGDMWYQVNRLGPMGMLMGVAADMYEVAHEASEGEMMLAAAHLQHAITQNILDESFMRGPADLIKAIEDPGRYGESYLKQFASSFVPFSVGMFQIARASDPYSREARNVMDSITAKIPGKSETLFPRISVWGEPMPNPEGFGLPGLTAVWMKKISDDPVNRAMLDLGIAPARVERKIRNVELTDAEYDDFARLAGRMAKMRLDVMVRSPDYQRMPAHIKAAAIRAQIEGSREAARGMMMVKSPRIPHDATEELKKRKTGEPVPLMH